MKRGLLHSKKGAEDFLNSKVAFIVLNVIFIALMLFYLLRVQKGASLIEQTYAKQIALIIDQAKPGTSLNIDISELYSLADKNNFGREGTVKIDYAAKKVIVKVADGRGYSFNFFSNSVIMWSVDKKSQKLNIEVKENV
ncbi:hypothetical protein A3K73_00105 [Candidatus Pacearchaeota archaeon RBG_13_36_9]|nr:MAG: hypothetical protein A3K73_00105 [Candidatus Pacearchaeota archaeon RBG_13_36_9]